MKLVSDSCFREKTCPQCGKKFWCYTDAWVYVRRPWKKTTKYFCTWSCLCKYDTNRIDYRTSKYRKLKFASGG